MSESRLRLIDALTVETDRETGASESSFCGSDVDAGWFPVANHDLIRIFLIFDFIYFNNF